MKELSTDKLNSLNPAVLAFVGDAVFSLYIRSTLASKHDYKSGELTRLSSRLVSAIAQSKMLSAISDKLSEEEADVVRRGRNCHTNNKAKNAGLMDYKRATGLEALIGYLYLAGREERLEEIQKLCLEAAE